MTDTPEQRNNMSPSLANVLGNTLTNHNQITPTEDTSVLELKSVLAPGHKILCSRPQVRLYFNNRPPIITQQTDINFILDQNMVPSANEEISWWSKVLYTQMFNCSFTILCTLDIMYTFQSDCSNKVQKS